VNGLSAAGMYGIGSSSRFMRSLDMSIFESPGTASAIAAKGIIRQYFFEDSMRPERMVHVRTLLIRLPSALLRAQLRPLGIARR
jgi:hypothetical protein